MGLFRRRPRYSELDLLHAIEYFTVDSPNRRAARRYRRLLARAVKAGG